VFENRVLRIFGLKSEVVTGGWRKLHKELHDFFSSPNIIRVLSSQMMKLVEYIAHKADEICIQDFIL
jgi:hypothetical protein